MNLTDITPNHLRGTNRATLAVARAAERTGRPALQIIREITRRPLRLPELLLIIEQRARAIADGVRP